MTFAPGPSGLHKARAVRPEYSLRRAAPSTPHDPMWSTRVMAALLVVPVGLVLLVALLVVLLTQGRPLFYASTRSGRGGVPFRLWKIRTMHVHARDEAVLGGDATADVTRVGVWMRRTRLDELPQIINLLRGDMTFVGPRPPLVRYVRDYPDVYLPLLVAPPGITGLATVLFCQRESGILASAPSMSEADIVYRRRCLRRKATLDRIYAGRRGPGLGCMVLVLTLWRGPNAQRSVRRVRHRVERCLGWRA